MRILVQVDDSPQGAGSDAALGFVEAALDAGHAVPRVFFYHQGVINGHLNADDPRSDDRQARWQGLAERAGVDLVLCVAAAQRRGVMDREMADEAGSIGNLAPGFRIAGLGQWIEAVCESERVVRFGSGVK